MTAKTMAEVLRQVQKDHSHVHTYRGGAQGCRCGQRDPNAIGSNSWIWGHTAEAGSAALTAAGFGLVADARSEALEEAADASNVNDERGLNTPEEVERRGYLQRHNRMSVTRWLRARAAEMRTP